MNSRRKGNRTELKGIKELVMEGYLVYRVKGSTKFNKNVDIFGLFDCLAIKHNESKLIQFKSNIKPNLDKFNEFKQKFPQFTVELWVKKDRKDFVIYSCG